MSGKSSHRLKSVIGLLVSAALLVYLALSVEWRRVGEEMARAAWWPLIPVTALWMVQLYARAWRWEYLIEGGSRFTLAQRFNASMIGNFASYILPLRAGEFIRPWALVRGSSTSYSAAFVSVVIERFFDLAAVLFSFCALLAFVPTLPDIAYTGAQAFGVLAGALFLFIVAAIFMQAPLLRLIAWSASLVPHKGIAAKVESFFGDFVRGAAVLRQGKNFAMVVLLTVVCWVATFVAFSMWLWVVNLEATILLGVAVTVLVALAVAAPSSPGFVGVYQAGCVAAFLLLGYSKETAVAYALISHVHQYIIVVGYGFYSLSKMQISLQQMKDATSSRRE